MSEAAIFRKRLAGSGYPVGVGAGVGSGNGYPELESEAAKILPLPHPWFEGVRCYDARFIRDYFIHEFKVLLLEMINILKNGRKFYE